MVERGPTIDEMIAWLSHERMVRPGPPAMAKHDGMMMNAVRAFLRAPALVLSEEARAVIDEAAYMLSDGQSGFIACTDSDTAWCTSRDKLVARLRAIASSEVASLAGARVDAQELLLQSLHTVNGTMQLCHLGNVADVGRAEALLVTRRAS